MNNERRKRIAQAQALLDEAFEILESCRDEEQEYYDAMPESLQGGEKGEAATSAIDYLEEAAQATSDATNILGNIG